MNCSSDGKDLLRGRIMGFSSQNCTKTTNIRAKATDLFSPKAKCCFTQPCQSWAQIPLPNPGMLGTALPNPGTVGTASPALPALHNSQHSQPLCALLRLQSFPLLHSWEWAQGRDWGWESTRAGGTASAWAAGCRGCLASEHLSRDQRAAKGHAVKTSRDGRRCSWAAGVWEGGRRQ